MCRRIGLVVPDGVDARDDVLEPGLRARGRHLLAQTGALALEPVAVAPQREHRKAAVQGERLPPEYRSVERPRRFEVAGVEGVEVQ